MRKHFRMMNPVFVMCMICILIALIVFPSTVLANQDWLTGPLEKYEAKINKTYLEERLTDEQIEQNAENLVRDFFTLDDLKKLAKPSVSELLAFPSLYNNKEIVFIGEAIGQPMCRNGYCWINVMDEEGNSIGCWMPSEFADDIKIYGRYRYRGDTLLVKGIYHIANEAHGGETEIEVNDLIVVENGEHYPPESVDMVFVYIVIVLFFGIVGLFIYKKYYWGKKNNITAGGIFFGDKN